MIMQRSHSRLNWPLDQQPDCDYTLTNILEFGG